MHIKSTTAETRQFLVTIILLLAVLPIINISTIASSYDHNPVVVGAWWDTVDGSEWTDQQLVLDISNIAEMRFTTLYLVEKSIMDGNKDSDLSSTWTSRVVTQSEDAGLAIMWAVWETDNPVQWTNEDLNNVTFREWFASHLSKWKEFIDDHPAIIGIVFDDFGVESEHLNMTEFTQFVRQYIPLPLLIEYDDRYDSLNPQYENGTITEGYIYYYQDADSWNGSWIDHIQQNFAGSYPTHTLGICLEAFDGGGGNWSPTKHRSLIDHALSYNFTNYEYWAWRWSTPESPAIAAHPEYWQDIKTNNEHILTQSTITELPSTLTALAFSTSTLLIIAVLRYRRKKKSSSQPLTD